MKSTALYGQLEFCLLLLFSGILFEDNTGEGSWEVKNLGQEVGDVAAMSLYRDLDFPDGGPDSGGWIKCLTWMFVLRPK